MSEKTLTGRKFFMIIASFFGVVIGANLFMAYMAISTFPGLVIKNAYVASQNFNVEKSAQVALGWKVSATVSGKILTLRIVDADGAAVRPATLEATLGRPTHSREDRMPAFEFNGWAFVAPVDISPGNWNLRLVATAMDGTAFRKRITIDGF